jgi:hypothetical protein
MSESRVRENRTHGSMRRREATPDQSAMPRGPRTPPADPTPLRGLNDRLSVREPADPEQRRVPAPSDTRESARSLVRTESCVSNRG